MGKGSRRKKDPGQFLDKLLRPWKRQRVTLTEAGRKQAPLRKGRARKKAAPKKSEGRPPTTLRERQARELQTLAGIGRRDPERLAAIVSRMLMEAREQDETAKLEFERLVWEKAEQKGKREESRDQNWDDSGGREREGERRSPDRSS